MKIKRINLEKIYRENTNKEACKILGICNFTLTAYLRRMGIKLKGSGNGVKKINKTSKKINENIDKQVKSNIYLC